MNALESASAAPPEQALRPGDRGYFQADFQMMEETAGRIDTLQPTGLAEGAEPRPRVPGWLTGGISHRFPEER